MGMKVFLRTAILGAALCKFAIATSHWSTPCLDGTCAFEIPASQSSMAGIIKIMGHPHSISDLSEASGWIVFDCTSDASVQDVRIICANGKDGCAHLFNGGADDTIIRLPKNCGKSPFARVAKCEVSNDQRIPHHVVSSPTERDGAPLQVHTLSFDNNFGKVDTSRLGPVSFEFIGSSDPHSMPSFAFDHITSKKRDFGFHDLSDSVKGLHPRQSSSFTGNATATATVNSTFNVFNHSIPCTDGNDEINVDVLATADASISLAFALVGSVTPASVTGGAFFTNMTADIGGSITLSSNVVGQVDTGRIALVQVPVPGLAIGVPDLFSVGVSFNVFAEADAELDVETQLGVGFAYHVGDLQLIFPPEDGSTSVATITPGDGDLQLSVSPAVASTAKATVHLIPSLNIGLTTVTENEVSASIFLDLDTSATLQLTLEAGSTTDVSSGSTETEVIGCVELDGGLSINAGAEGTFFTLFNDSTQVPVASTDLQLFQKCFTKEDPGGSSTSSSSTPSSSSGSSSSSSSMKRSATSLFTLIMHALAVIWIGVLISGVGATPFTSLEDRAEKATNDTSNATFACPGSNIKPVTSLINQPLHSSDYKNRTS